MASDRAELPHLHGAEILKQIENAAQRPKKQV
jgi:hypothetical protein